MSHSAFAVAVERARQVTRLPATDGELVARFASTGDPDAALFAKGGVPYIAAWSPDGKRAVGRRFLNGRIGVVGTDGTGAKTIFSSDASDPKARPLSLTLFDWR